MKIELIDISKDECVAYKINQLIDKRMTENYQKTPAREYLGVSQIGEECLRKLQYQYKYKKPNFDARTLRVLNMGNNLEDLIANWMRLAGFDLVTRDENGCQFGFKAMDGKIQGHIDGIIKKWPADLEIKNFRVQGSSLLWECKSMNSQNWNEFRKHGVLTSHFVYYVQVQLYMAYMDLESCLLTALNKNTGELHHEIVEFDKEVAQIYSDRGIQIIKSTEHEEVLGRISNNRNFVTCKMCNYQKQCLEDGDGIQNLTCNLFENI